MVRNIVRLLAPLAIAAVGVGVYLIVDSNVNTTKHTKTVHTSETAHRARHRAAKKAAKPRVYVVKSGDTLSAIAARTDVPLGELTSLNPSLQPPYSLSTGQRLRLRR